MNKRFLAKKRFGQNFLVNFYYIQQLISSLKLNKNDHIVEIGPGKGALTKHILPSVEYYDAIEIDRDLIPILKKNFFNYPSFHLHCKDALQFNFEKLYRHNPMRLIGNLPYNISSPLLFRLFNIKDTLIKDMHFMLQQEVAERITAKVRTPQYGRLSVMAQYFCDVELLFSVPKEAFTPKPKVISAVCRFVLKPSNMLTAKNHDLFASVVKEAFTYRRKILGNSLKKYIDSDKLHSLGIDPVRRAETLSVDEFITISNAIG